jgi:nucleoside-diphosphate-sugar epimerase
MRVFLTSATGYVGAAVATRLQARGHAVAALARSAGSEARLRVAGIRPVPGNLARAETYGVEVESADAVVHTAFEYSTDGAENLDLDLQATGTLLRARRLIYTSNAYRPRIAVERMLGPSAVAIRVGMVYGGCGGGTIASLFAAARRNGQLPYLRDAANHRWSLIYLDDLAALYARLVETRAAGVFNGVDGQPLSVCRTLECAADVSGVAALPADEALVTSVQEQHTVDVMKRDVALDCNDARELDWSPRYRSFEEGAATAYAEWCAQ